MEVLQDFPVATANVPFQYLFDLIPILQPRAFSIASSMQVSTPARIYNDKYLTRTSCIHTCRNILGKSKF